MTEKVRVEELDPATYELLQSHYKARLEFCRFGDIGCTLSVAYKEDADNIRNMAVRPDDVWVVTFPRSGTTWTQELIWMLMNKFDYETALRNPLSSRYIFLERSIHVFNSRTLYNERLDPMLRENLRIIPSFDSVINAPSPRFVKTHIPFSLLPPTLLDTTKVVYVARDPRDVAVSFYHHNRLLMNYEGDFKSYWNLFINDLVSFSPFFPHLKEAWNLRDHANMLFIFYEEMIKDLPLSIKRIAEFYGKEVNDEQVTKLSEHLDIKNFRKNESVNPPWLKQLNPDAEGFVRKGKAGAWREDFDEEMTAQAQRWMRENLAGTDLCFPQHNYSSATSLTI